MSNKKNKKNNVETGFSEEGLPYARIGNKSKIIVNLQALSFKNEPASGYELKAIKNSYKKFNSEYTLFLVGRKQGLPKDYSFEDMANDYAQMIRREFKKPITIIGESTGGQIAHYLAASHPDVVKKLVIISAAYRISKEGAEIENDVAEYVKQEKYGKAFLRLLDLIWSSKISKMFAKILTRLFVKSILGNIEYPNDVLTELYGDIEMNFKNRLQEIKAPTLILCGDSDIEYTADLVRETAEGIPNAKLILYKGYGHNLMFRNRKQVQKDILKFLKS
jgi:pimeloyl-ACP methyl ester carboxylesterase